MRDMYHNKNRTKGPKILKIFCCNPVGDITKSEIEIDYTELGYKKGFAPEDYSEDQEPMKSVRYFIEINGHTYKMNREGDVLEKFSVNINKNMTEEEKKQFLKDIRITLENDVQEGKSMLDYFINYFDKPSKEENKNNYVPDWRIGKYYIHESFDDKFEVIQYKSCRNGSHALVGTGNSYDEAFKKLEERNCFYNYKLIEKKFIEGVEYFNYK